MAAVDGQEEYLASVKELHIRRMRLLNQQAARQGANTPPEITMEIEDIQAKLDDLDLRLAGKPVLHRSGVGTLNKRPTLLYIIFFACLLLFGLIFSLLVNRIQTLEKTNATQENNAFIRGTEIAELNSTIIAQNTNIAQNKATIVAISPTSCTYWNLAKDTLKSQINVNPYNDSCGDPNVWYFMKRRKLINDYREYTLLSDFTGSAFGVPNLQQWYYGPYKSLPSIGINRTGSLQDTNNITWPANTIHVHPSMYHDAVIGWRSPIQGNIKIIGSVGDLNNICTGSQIDGISWFIDAYAINLSNGVLPSGQRELFSNGNNSENLKEVQVTPGEWIYFIINMSNNEDCDSTSVDISITKID